MNYYSSTQRKLITSVLVSKSQFTVHTSFGFTFLWHCAHLSFTASLNTKKAAVCLNWTYSVEGKRNARYVLAEYNTIWLEILVNWWFWEQSCQFFILQKIHSVVSSLLWNHSLCTRPADGHASLIVGIEFTIGSCVQGHCFSKELCTPKVGEELACLSMRGRRSKRRAHGCCKEQCNKNSPD